MVKSGFNIFQFLRLWKHQNNGTNCVIEFNVKRITGGFFPTQRQQFYCTLTFTFNKQNLDGPVNYSFSLRRDDGSGVAFTLAGKEKMTGSKLESATNQQILAEKLQSVDFLKQMKYFPDSKNRDKFILYDFSDPTNIPIFVALAGIFENSEYTTKAKNVITDEIDKAAAAVAAKQKIDDISLEQESLKARIKSEFIPEAIKENAGLDDDSFQTEVYDADKPELKFGSIKKDLIGYAKEQKTLIDGNDSFSDIQKENYKSQIDELLKLLLFAQFMFMTKLKINRYVSKKLRSQYILDWEVSLILKKMKELTEYTKQFIENLFTGTGNEEANQQTYPFSNLKSSLEKFAEECKQIKEDINLTSYADFKSLVETRKNQIDADVDSPSQPSQPVVSETSSFDVANAGSGTGESQEVLAAANTDTPP